MNDRYLFKAKRIDNGEWVSGYYSKNHIGKHFVDAFEVKPDTICQNFPCGGCSLDEKPIWENDIVATDDGTMGIVRFGLYDSTHFGFYIEWMKEKYWRSDIVYWLPRIKSITNIFNNPELLEVE